MGERKTHLVPAAEGVTQTLCQNCHSAIHATFTNQELERQYSTVEALLAHEGFAQLDQFIAKQDSRVRTRSRHSHVSNG